MRLAPAFREALGRSWAHLASRVAIEGEPCSSCRERRLWLQPTDPAHLSEECPRHGGFGQLEDSVVAVPCDSPTNRRRR